MSVLLLKFYRNIASDRYLCFVIPSLKLCTEFAQRFRAISHCKNPDIMLNINRKAGHSYITKGKYIW